METPDDESADRLLALPPQYEPVINTTAYWQVSKDSLVVNRVIGRRLPPLMHQARLIPKRISICERNAPYHAVGLYVCIELQSHQVRLQRPFP